MQLGHAQLFSSGSKKELPPIEHQFVTYRGFTYKFGKNYAVQILDISDPIYKYINDRGLNSNGINLVVALVKMQTKL